MSQFRENRLKLYHEEKAFKGYHNSKLKHSHMIRNYFWLLMTSLWRLKYLWIGEEGTYR